jgi:hypothetical protein
MRDVQSACNYLSAIRWLNSSLIVEVAWPFVPLRTTQRRRAGRLCQCALVRRAGTDTLRDDREVARGRNAVALGRDRHRVAAVETAGDDHVGRQRLSGGGANRDCRKPWDRRGRLSVGIAEVR